MLPNWESLQTTILNRMKTVQSSSKPVEHTMGKGEIARNEQFLLFPWCFYKILNVDM